MVSYEYYYVFVQSKWLIIVSIGLLVMVFGLGIWFNDFIVGYKEFYGLWIFFVGGLIIVYMLFGWFGNVICESCVGFYSVQMDCLFCWGMSWFIFFEVMFFVVFFGVLFYVCYFVGFWFGGEGVKGVVYMFWLNFQYSWLLLQILDLKLFLLLSVVIELWKLLLINIILLVIFSFIVIFVYYVLKKNKCGLFKVWLVLIVLLGIVFLILQVEEYVYVYNELGLIFGVGIYGLIFFMFIGFYGVYVIFGVLIFGIMLICILCGYFDVEYYFGFEVVSWYWYFVDVVWIGLFIFVYVI